MNEEAKDVVNDKNEEHKDPEIGVHPDFIQIPEVKLAADTFKTIL